MDISRREVLDAIQAVKDPQGRPAWIEGQHMRLAGGQHASEYLNKNLVLARVDVVNFCCQMLAARLDKEKIDVVLGPAPGGIVLSQWMAQHLSQSQRKMVWSLHVAKGEGKRFTLKPNLQSLLNRKRILIVDDILATGSGTSTRQTIRIARNCGASQVVGVAVLANLGFVNPNELEVPWITAVVDMPMGPWDPGPNTCPLCKKKVPLFDIGYGT